MAANPCTYQDIGSISLIFLGKQCAGNPGDPFPDLYASASPPQGGGGSDLSFRDTASAYYAAPTAGDPTNKSTLDALSKQFASDFFQWIGFSWDQTVVGICNIPPVPLYDQIIFDYYEGEGMCRTRVETPPIMSHPRELGHYDSAGDCILTASPCVYFYGPPISGNQIARYSLCLQDGRLFANYIKMDNF